jgi:hypothetical protein
MGGRSALWWKWQKHIDAMAETRRGPWQLSAGSQTVLRKLARAAADTCREHALTGTRL